MKMKIETEKWKSALLSTLFISILPNLLLYLIPMKWLTKGKQDSLNIQHILLCFAAGGLLGDVLLHSLPHLLIPHDHNHNEEQEHEEHHDNEKLRSLNLYEEHDHQQFEHNHEHDHDHNHNHNHDHNHDHEYKLDSITNDHHNSHEHLMYIGLLVIVGYLIFFLSERLLSLQLNTNSNESEKKRKDGTKHSHSHNHSHNHNHSHVISANITVMGWLNIIADLMHNFTDGIAMGASYATNSSSTTLGLAATMSILFHEIPHEIGDFTVLIESGVSKSEAIKVQFITAIAAFVGTVIGLMSNGAGVWNEILLAITSGGFIYVSTSSLIPSILNKGPESTTTSPYTQILLECIGFLAGVGAMYIVGFFE